MKLIVAVDENWAIGNKNELLIRIPADMKMFRHETLGKVVILGRKTLETFPGQRPLEQRTNIILSTDPSYQVKGGTVVHSLEELWEELKAYKEDDIYVIGGESIYRQLADHCNEAYITKIQREYEADAFFPNLDEKEEWKLTAESEEQTYFDTLYTFVKYEKIK